MGRIEKIPVARVIVGEQSLRYEPEDDGIIELASSIERDGLLQPVGVREITGKKFQLLWGGRRLAAHRRLKRVDILAHVYQDDEAPIKAVALIENLQRVDLTLQEECEAVGNLHYEQEKSPDQISALLSKSRSWVMRRLALPSLPEELRGPVFDGRLSIAAAEEISKVADPGSRVYLASQALQCGWTSADVSQAVATYLISPSIESAVAAAKAVREEVATATDGVAVCAACGISAPYRDLVNVWIHKNGSCPPAGSLTGEGPSVDRSESSGS